MDIFRYFCNMKRFRSITIITLSAIAVMVAANIACLVSLYSSIKDEAVRTATECLRRADILEIISRMKGTQNGTDDSFIQLTLMIQGEQSDDGSYRYPNLLENLDRTMSNYFHFIASATPEMPERDYGRLADLFRLELSEAGFNPEHIIVSEGTEAHQSHGNWRLCIDDPNGQPLICAYISPLTGYIFKRMSGIIITSAGILVLMSFLIWYLLHWVGKLKSIEQMKDDFTHNMTHELKTPVAVAYSAADSMLRYYDQSDEKRNRQLLSIILQRLNYLSGMIENILSMSMERFKTMRLNVEKVPLKPLVEEVAGMIELKADKAVNIETEIEAEAAVAADPLHLGNMISNLLDNALKYSGEKVSIKIRADKHRIVISDDGIGIRKECLPHIFDKFYRVTDGDKYSVGGYGLGLYYVKQVAGLHGWTIAVESTPGSGSAFTINFDGNEKR